MRKLILLLIILMSQFTANANKKNGIQNNTSGTGIPSITSFSPAYGPVGTLVTIKGINFDTTTSFLIGGVSAIMISVNDSVLVGMVMPGAVTGSISFATSGGAATSTNDFVITPTEFPSVQQGNKLVGTILNGLGYPNVGQGRSVSISGDGTTAVVAGGSLAWIYILNAGVWTQQANNLAIGGGYGSVGISADGNTIIFGANNQANIYTRSGGVWTLQANNFGISGIASVAISADGNTIAIGSPYDSAGIGAVWVFTRSGSVWTQQGNKLVGSDGVQNPYQYQGSSVSISSDGNTIIEGGDNDSMYTGAAWVFTRSGGNWSQQGGKLVGTGGSGHQFQGQCVSISGDGNTAIVGGSQAWIFIRSGGVWTQQANNIGTGGAGSVSISSDGNTVIVGAYGDNSGIGAAWVYTRNGSIWTQQGDKFVADDGGSQLGTSVSISGDGNTAIVGAPFGNYGSGDAWVYNRSGVVWNQPGSKLAGTLGAGANPEQGFSVAISADGNTAIVGGPLAADSSTDNGAAWIYIRKGGVWTQQTNKLIGTGGIGGSGQGYSVAISADGNTAVVGAPGDNGGIGAVWIFTRNGNAWTQQGNKLIGTGFAGSSRQGYSVSISADGNTVAVGGPDDPVGDNGGSTWIFTRNNGVWTQQGNKLIGAGAESNGATQGLSVAISGDGNTVVIGGGSPGGGVAIVTSWVFVRNNGIWTQQGTYLVGGTGGDLSESSGVSVAINADGNTIIMGEPNNGATGAVWIFKRSAGVWTHEADELVGTGGTGDGLIGNGLFQGTSVSLSADGNTAIVGGSNDGYGGGAVWVFARANGVWRQKGNKLVGTGAVGGAYQGYSVSLSADGNTAIVGGLLDSLNVGASWVYFQNVSFTWNGNESSDWMDANNWSGGIVPGINNDVVIPAGTTFSPIVYSGTNTSCKNVNVLAGAVLTIETGAILNITH